jgi:predicted dehydrogenase
MKRRIDEGNAMRVGVIGTGFGARVVAPAFAATPGVSVVEVVSPRDADAVKRVCTRADVDLVSIHSPPFMHRAQVALAAYAGKAVLCDKPLGIDEKDAAASLDTARRAGIRHFVNVEFRCDPIREKLREQVQAGAIGRVEHISWTSQSAGSRVPLRRYGWLFDAARNGGWIQGWAPHAVDFLLWGIGSPVRSVSGERRLTLRERPDAEGRMHACTAEDGLMALLTLDNGASVALDSSFAAAVPVAPRLVVLGSEGALLNEGSRLSLLRGKQRQELLQLEGAADNHVVPMGRFCARLRDALRGEAPRDLPTFEDGVAIERVLDQLRALPLAK